MKLSRHSRFVRWAFMVEKSIPYRASVCELFWRAFLLAPIFAVFFAVMFIVLSPFFFVAWLHDTYQERRYPGQAPRPLSARISAALESSVFYQGVLAWKRKVCPIVDLTDDESASTDDA